MYHVSTHSRPKAAGIIRSETETRLCVSTHSRPKAAGLIQIWKSSCMICFNTQPPEGGWSVASCDDSRFTLVSTHSRPKAAGPKPWYWQMAVLFQHTAARRRLAILICSAPQIMISFNTQPPEGGWTAPVRLAISIAVSTHSRPKAAGYRNQHYP